MRRDQRFDGASSPEPSASADEARVALALLLRVLKREAHVLAREPSILAPHLYNGLYLDEGHEGGAGILLTRAAEALRDRRWLRLTNRPPVNRAAIVRVLEHGGPPSIAGGVSSSPVTAIAWSPGGEVLASGSRDGAIRTWDVASGIGIARLNAGSEVTSLAWSPDGAILASAGTWDGTVRLWDADGSGSAIVVDDCEGGVRAVAWSPDGMLASGGSDGRVRLRDPSGANPVAVVGEPTLPVSALAWSPDGTLLAWATGGGETVWLWRSGEDQLEAFHQERPWTADALAWSEDGSPVAVGIWGSAIRLWDPRTRFERAIVEEAGDGAVRDTSVASADCARIAAVVRHDLVQVCDVSSTRRVVLEGHTGIVHMLAWSPSGRILASGGSDGCVRFWEPDTADNAAGAEQEAGEAGTLAWSPDGAWLAASGGGIVRRWNGTTGARGAAVGRQQITEALAWTPDGTLLAGAGGTVRPDTMSFDGAVEIWDTTTGGTEATLRGHTDLVRALSWSPSGDALASGGAFEDRTVRLWERPWLSPKLVIGPLPRYTGGVGALAWSPDGNALAVATARDVRLQDPVSGVLLAVLAGHTGWIAAVAWSPDGTLIASAGEDRTVRLWDPSVGEMRAVLEGHEGPICAVAWSRDSAHMLTGGDDCVVRMWDVRTGTSVLLARCLSPVRALGFGPNGLIHAADTGSATGNRPTPYQFEPRNVAL